MTDRFTRGLIAGVVASIPAFIINMIAFSFELTTLRWAGFAGHFLYGHKPETMGEEVFAVLGVFFFSGLLGIIFSYLLPHLSSQNYLLKGVVFSLTVWFVSFAITFLFQVPGLQDVPLKTVVTNFVSALAWGVVLGYVLDWLDNRLTT